jgi:hypothetical protein
MEIKQMIPKAKNLSKPFPVGNFSGGKIGSSNGAKSYRLSYLIFPGV